MIEEQGNVRIVLNSRRQLRWSQNRMYFFRGYPQASQGYTDSGDGDRHKRTTKAHARVSRVARQRACLPRRGVKARPCARGPPRRPVPCERGTLDALSLRHVIGCRDGRRARRLKVAT